MVESEEIPQSRRRKWGEADAEVKSQYIRDGKRKNRSGQEHARPLRSASPKQTIRKISSGELR